MTKAIYFDMDGTIADFYGVENWLDYLKAEKTKPYRMARSLVNMRKLAKVLNQLQQNGYHIGVISWGSKFSTDSYLDKVQNAKIKWLAKHLGSVNFDEVKIVHYGTPKGSVVKFPNGILFDDEEQNRKAWNGKAYDVNAILETLNALLKD